MITETELNLLNLSATKKDFYQIWNELLDVASKITERWDPQSTNETDPGIVLLKVLAAVADKLNYNIDKNILEAFMPTAAQDESMRKLCDMMGYAIKYYQSATTNVTLSYIADTSTDALPDTGLTIPMFTTITNADEDISYVTTASAMLLNTQTTVEIPCIEGQVVQCETDTDNIISLASLDEQNRYYLPETQVAENGIFIYNINDNSKSDAWEQVDNLNTQPTQSKVYKFGFDSNEYRPYIQFPEDIGNLIEDGLELYYIRTSGISGNVSAQTLTSFSLPTTDEWENYTDSTQFTVKNYSAATNGRNPESISEAYNAFKKTVGTFDTLVTCRDYMNKIYNLVTSTDTYLVSNVVVSDIRDDINRAQNICSFNEYGICYVDSPVIETDGTDAISHFDLILYPFKVYNNLSTKTDFQNSFTYDGSNVNLIESLLQDSKTISHQFQLPRSGDIVCIKNYLRLNAKISTTAKVNKLEEAIIIGNIKASLYSTFNMRAVDFGYEIPFDSILECIQDADTRIKNVSLEEPILYTKFACLVDGKMTEYDCASSSTEEAYTANALYNKLALRNILSGRLSLFNYDKSFGYDFTEVPYDSFTVDKVADYGDKNVGGGLVKESDGTYSYHEQYPTNIEVNGSTNTAANPIKMLKSELLLDLSKDIGTSGLVLNDHEVIRFRAPNFITTTTYPAYVNYYLKLDSGTETTSAIPATFTTLRAFLGGSITDLDKTVAESYTSSGTIYWDVLANFLAQTSTDTSIFGSEEAESNERSNVLINNYGMIFTKDTSSGIYKAIPTASTITVGEYLYYINLSEKTFSLLVRFLQLLHANNSESTLKGLFRKVASAGSYTPGYLVDASYIKYGECTIWRTFSEPLDDGFFVQLTHDNEQSPEDGNALEQCWTKDGLGLDAETAGIPANAEYQLKANEYLLINYTPSSTSEEENVVTETVNEVYKYGDIIRPNFELIDSEFKHSNQGKAYAKTSGFDFSQSGSGITNPLGMFSLGSSEQIEIRSLVQITLKDMIVNLYWKFDNDDNALTRSTPGITTNEAAGTYSYTLQAGEYLYYTNERKQDLAFYGEGTELILTGSLMELSATDGVTQVLSEDEAYELGLAGIPWHTCELTTANYITLKEYQYVTLTQGDTLISCSLVGTDTFSNQWTTCQVSSANPVIYSIGDTKYTLPVLSISDMHWEGRSLLEFETGPETAQTLYRSGASITAYADTTGTNKIIKITPAVETKNVDGTDVETVKEISFKASEDIIASADTVYLYDTSDSSEDSTESSTLLLKVFTNSAIKIKSDQESILSTTLALHNVDNYYTKLSMANLIDDGTGTTKVLQLPISVSNNNYVLMMVYYKPDSEYADASDDAGFSITGVDEEDYPVIFNNVVDTASYDETETETESASEKAIKEYIATWGWWSGRRISGTDKVSFKFKPGLNLIYFKASVTIEIEPDTNGAGLILFADPTPIYDTNGGIDNTLLCYKDGAIAETDDAGNITYTAVPYALQILKDLAAIDTDHTFYYNCPIENDRAIDLSAERNAEDDTETLEAARTWYDTNNINNKFVISEIDADYLDTGIQIAKSSKA